MCIMHSGTSSKHHMACYVLGICPKRPVFPSYRATVIAHYRCFKYNRALLHEWPLLSVAYAQNELKLEVSAAH